MDLSGEFPMRTAAPVNFEASLASAALLGAEPEEETKTAFLVDPLTRSPLGLVMTPRQADRIRSIFDRLTAAGDDKERRAREAGETRASAALEAAEKLRDAVNEAAMIGLNLRSLAYLFLKAVADDGEDNRLTSASHLVIDCMETMAKRLDGLDELAQALYAPLIPDRRG